MDFDFTTETITPDSTTVLTIGGVGAIEVPAGTTAQQPGGVVGGALRYNTDNARYEGFFTSTWANIGSVSSVAATAPAAGFTVTGSPITSSGTLVFALANDLAAVEGLTTTGVAVRTATDTWTTRAMTGTLGNITVVNGDGVAGAPTFNLGLVSQVASGSFVKVTLDGFGRVTGNTPVTTADLTPLLSTTYLALAGGTMTGAINMGSNLITNLATPVAGTDAANKNYVDSSVAGLSWKQAVLVATTANITLSGAQTIDGVAVVAGNRVLVKNQTDPTQNGIYIAAAGAWARAADSTTGTQIDGEAVYVQRGTTFGDTGWTETATVTTVGTDPITYAQFSGSGSYTAGTGLTLTGNTFSLTSPVAPTLGGTGTVTAPTSGQVLIGTSGGVYAPATITATTGISLTSGSGTLAINNTGVTSLVAGTGITVSGATGAVTVTAVNNGTVTSVAATAPAAGLTITGSPITSNGTLVFALANDLAAVEGLATTGLAVRTATDTWTTRAVTGTAARVTVTNGDGVAGAPTIDIASTYVGQASITTLGTITTGTWNGTTIAAANGGTGQTTYAVGDILYASGTTALSKLSDVATGSALISGGVGVAPAWGKISLTTAVSGVLPVANGGTNLSALGTANQILGVNAGATALEYKTVTAGTGITITNTAGVLTIATAAGTGTVTSVALAVTGPLFTVTGSPVTTAGTLTATLNTQAANLVFAGPATGANAAPTFRALAYADLPLSLYVENPSTPVAPTAVGANAVAIGSGATAPGAGSLAFGAGSSAAANTTATSNGSFASAGDAQQVTAILRNITTNATATTLFLDGATASSRMVLPANSAWLFSINVVGRRTDATGGIAAFTFTGVITRDATIGTTALSGIPSKTTVQKTDATWNAVVSADAVNGALQVQVTGQAAKTIRWVATVELTQVTN